MGNNLFKAQISKQVAKALGQGLLPATLTVYTVSTINADPSQGASSSSISCACRGFVEEYGIHQVDGSLVQVGDRKVSILGDTITPAAVPKPGDGVTIEGRGWTIIRVERDPDAAMYTCQVRG